MENNDQLQVGNESISVQTKLNTKKLKGEIIVEYVFENAQATVPAIIRIIHDGNIVWHNVRTTTEMCMSVLHKLHCPHNKNLWIMLDLSIYGMGNLYTIKYKLFNTGMVFEQGSANIIRQAPSRFENDLNRSHFEQRMAPHTSTTIQPPAVQTWPL